MLRVLMQGVRSQTYGKNHATSSQFVEGMLNQTAENYSNEMGRHK